MSPAAAYERIRSIGGSDVAVILGLSKYCSEAELYDRITGAIGEKPSKPVMDRGHAMEDIMADLYVAASGRRVWQVDRVLHPTLPAHASPDRMQAMTEAQLAAIGHDDDMGYGVLEMKAPGSHVIKGWKENGFPRDYYAQMQHYMWITNAQWGTFCALDYDKWEVWYVDVPRDQAMIAQIETSIRQWWDQYVETGVRPPETYADENGDQWPMPSPGARGATDYCVVEGPEWEQAILELKQASEEVSLAEHSKRLCQQRVKTLMGDSYSAVMLKTGEKVSWRESTSRHFSKDRLAAAHPDVDMDVFYDVKATRSFRTSF